MTTSFTRHFRFGIPDFLSGPWHEDFATLVTHIDRVLYSTILGGDIAIWSNSTIYAEGNKVISPEDGTLWICDVAHTSAASPTTFAADRVAHPTFWLEIESSENTASEIAFTPAGNIVATNVQDAIVELDTEKVAKAGDTMSGPLVIALAVAGTALQLISTDAGALTGPNITLSRNSATPAVNDALGALVFNGKTNTGADASYGYIYSFTNNVTNGAHAGVLVFGVATAGALTDELVLSGSTLTPLINDGLALGTNTQGYADLFLASGGVVNFASGDATITHVASNVLRFNGASVTFDSGIFPETSGIGSLGDTLLRWNGAFFAANSAINFNSGDVLITHSANFLAFTGAASGYSFDAPTFLSTTAAGTLLQLTSTDAGASSGPNVLLYRDSATPAALDILGIIQTSGRTSTAATVTYSYIYTQLNDATNATYAGAIVYGWATAGVFADRLSMTLTNFLPVTNDGVALGATTNNFSDLFLALGAVINFNAGDVTITHAANSITFAGAANGWLFAEAVAPTTNDGAPLGSGTVSWADLFLATGGIINWNNGNARIMHTAGSITFDAGSSSTYVFSTGSVTFNTVAAGSISACIVNASAAGVAAGFGFQDNGTSKWFLYKETDNSFKINDFANSVVALKFTQGAAAAGFLTVAYTTASTTTATGCLVLGGGLGVGGALFVGTTGNIAGVLTAASGTATPAAGSTAARLLLGTTAGFGIYYGSGAPTVSAAQGSIYLRSDGSSTTTRAYINNSAGSGTTWTAISTVA